MNKQQVLTLQQSELGFLSKESHEWSLNKLWSSHEILLLITSGKTRASLHISADLTEPLLLAYTKDVDESLK